MVTMSGLFLRANGMAEVHTGGVMGVRGEFRYRSLVWFSVAGGSTAVSEIAERCAMNRGAGHQVISISVSSITKTPYQDTYHPFCFSEKKTSQTTKFVSATRPVVVAAAAVTNARNVGQQMS